jgi:hypothetical protein
MFTPNGTMRGAPPGAFVSKMNFSTAFQPGRHIPGQWLASQPRSLRMACHSFHVVAAQALAA